jgi:hypothetical protein
MTSEFAKCSINPNTASNFTDIFGSRDVRTISQIKKTADGSILIYKDEMESSIDSCIEKRHEVSFVEGEDLN